MKEDSSNPHAFYENVVTDTFPVSIGPVHIIKRRRPAGVSRSTLRHTRRAYARIYFRADLIVSEDQSVVCYKAVTVNQSAGGMCFESPRPLTPNTMVRIKIRESEKTVAGAAAETHRARVVWCRTIAGNETPRFAVGVAYRDACVN